MKKSPFGEIFFAKSIDNCVKVCYSMTIPKKEVCVMRYYKVVSFKKNFEDFDGFTDLFVSKFKKDAVAYAKSCTVEAGTVVRVDRYVVNDGWYSFDAEVFRRAV